LGFDSPTLADSFHFRDWRQIHEDLFSFGVLTFSFFLLVFFGVPFFGSADGELGTIPMARGQGSDLFLNPSRFFPSFFQILFPLPQKFNVRCYTATSSRLRHSDAHLVGICL